MNHVKIESLAVYNGSLYAATNNHGVELWRTMDGLNWVQINADGFGENDIFGSLLSWHNRISGEPADRFERTIWRSRMAVGEIAV